MKYIRSYICLLLFIFVYASENKTNNYSLPQKMTRHGCGAGKNIYKLKSVNFNTKKNLTKRNLDNNDDETYTPINIYYDMTYLNNQKEILSSNKIEKIEMIDKAMSRCVNIFKKLINIKQHLSDPIKVKNEQDLKEWKFNTYKIDDNLMPKGKGILCDLLILIRFKNENEVIKYDLPDASAVYIDEYTKRPILGVLVIDDEFQLKKNSQDYLEYLLLHGITHILGFSYNLFSSFPGQLSGTILIEKEVRTNKEKYKIKTPKVLEFAKKYFNCNSITGVELENKEDNVYPSHWEARILLGEYMNSEPYTPEQAISEFTLALLEDSGWYKANYYTGGLMRFGKNQGCNFINKDCLKYKSFIYEVNFKNEFCDPSINWVPSCSSGRQSRSYCSTELNEIDPDFQRFGNYRGRANSDYCFVNDFFPSEEASAHYVGNCKKGEGNYGSNILYNDNIKESNSKIPQSFGEKYGNNSFCALSSVIPKAKTNKDTQIYNKFIDVVHSMCYPMFCSEKSLTIQINNQYIVCPREGGKVELLGDYTGELFCPDYNLICTGTVQCNDMFDCVEKESLAKDNTYEYDYKIQTSQHLPDLLKSEVNEGYEGSETDGKCPKDCHQCLSNQKCIKCKPDYKLMGVKKNDENPIKCKYTDEIQLYYKDKEDNTYYKCPDYCLSCVNDGICTVCDNIHRLIPEENICEEKVKNCEIYESNNEDCHLCKKNYFFINEDRRHCYDILDDKNKYYPENKGAIYYSCFYGVSNCEECLNKTYCTKCKDNYFFINEDRGICYNEIDNSKYYPEENNKIYYSCEHNLPNCEECLDKNTCSKCKEGYFFINEDRTQCFNKIDKNKYYPEKNGTIYYLCKYNLPNCEECSDKNTCTKCMDGYFFINEDRTRCFNKIDEKKYYTEDNGIIYYSCNYNLPNCEECLDKNTCSKCKKGYYFINEDRTQCYNEIEKYKYYPDYNGTIYYSCGYNLPNCEECIDKYTCIKCKPNYFFINNDRSQCYNKLDDNDKYYSNENKTIYYLCNTSIPHCEKCLNKNECLICEDNYFFINDDRSKCYNKIDEKKYYPEDGGKIYYSCSHNMEHCVECENKTKCILCEDNFYLSGKNSLCYPISTVPFNKCKIIFSNIDDKNKLFNDNSYLISLINNYLSEYNDVNYIIKHYTNSDNNYTITIFKAALCTKLLVESGFYSLDTNDILKKVNLDFLYNNDNYVHCFVKYGLQNYFILYNREINSFLDLSTLNPKSYNIMNNFTYEMNNLLGKKVSETIRLNNIDIFDTKESIFNDMCHNFTVKGIDLPYNYRLNKLYLGNISDEVICTSDKCKKSEFYMSSLTGSCKCDINEDINYLNNQPKDIFLETYKTSSKTKDSFKIFSCFKRYYKLSSNVGVMIFIVFILIHILSIAVYYLFIKKIYGYKEMANPPIKYKKGDIDENDDDISEQEEEKENENENNQNESEAVTYSNCDQEKRLQDKDIVYDIETINSGTMYDQSIKDININIHNNDIIKEKEMKELEILKMKNQSIINLLENKNVNFNTKKMTTNNRSKIPYDTKRKDKEDRKLIEKIEKKSNKLKNNKISSLKNEMEMNSYKVDEQNITDLIYKNKEESKETSNNKNEIASEGRSIFKHRRNIKNRKDNSNQITSSENHELIEGKENICSNAEKASKNTTMKNFEENNSIIQISKIKKKNSKIIYIDCKNDSKKEEEKNSSNKTEKMKSNEDSNNNTIIKTIKKEDKKPVIEEDKTNTIIIPKNNKNNNKLEEKKDNNAQNTIKPKENKEREIVIDEKEFETRNIYMGKNFKNLQKETSERIYFKNKNIVNNNINNLSKVKTNNKKFVILFKYKEDSDEEEENNSKIDINNSAIDYLPFKQIKFKDNRTFIELYWHILSLKHPIINLFSFIKYFNITKSYIPLSIKINKLFFITMINLFVNSISLSQAYFIKKYEYFSEKYNIQNSEDVLKSNKIVQYAMRHGFGNAMLSFGICLVIFYLFEYIFFNIRRKINSLSMEENPKLNRLNVKVIHLIKTVRKKYLAYICISSFFMIVFGIYLINFSFAYPGGVLDYVSNSIITFIFLQIFPFITSLLICLMRYYSFKKNSQGLYEFSQILFS